MNAITHTPGTMAHLEAQFRRLKDEGRPYLIGYLLARAGHDIALRQTLGRFFEGRSAEYLEPIRDEVGPDTVCPAAFYDDAERSQLTSFAWWAGFAMDYRRTARWSSVFEKNRQTADDKLWEILTEGMLEQVGIAWKGVAA